MNEPRSFYLPSPDDLYKDLCREMQSDMYDMYWHDTKNENVSMDASTQSGTLHSWSAALGGTFNASLPRIIRLEYVHGDEAGAIDFHNWYENVVESCCGERLITSGNSCYIVFETVEDAALVYEYLVNVAQDDSIRVSLTYNIPGGGGELRGGESSPASSNKTATSVNSAFPLRRRECAGGSIVHVVMSFSTCMDRVIEDFSQYGKIKKIIMFTKDTTVQALIEYASHEGAVLAVNSGGKEGITSIQYSRLEELNIQQNNNRAWDFTIAPERQTKVNLGEFGNDSGPISQLSVISIGFNEILSMKKLPKELKDWVKSVESTSSMVGCNVIIVYNISCDNVNEIFNIFSIYGICSRVKILRQKKQCVLIQYSDPVYSSFAKYFLNRIPFWTTPGLQISYSKIDHVKINNIQEAEPASPPCEELSRVYTQADQRFCEVYKYGNCVCFPSETIFIASISDQTPRAHLLQLVSSVGKPVAHDIRSPYPGGPKKTHMLVQYQDIATVRTQYTRTSFLRQLAQ